MTSSSPRDAVREQALAWLVRLRDPDFADWAAFEAWLQAAPGHGEAYFRLAQADLEMGELLAAGRAAAPVEGLPRRRRAEPRGSRRAHPGPRLLGGVAAAAAAAVALVVLIPRAQPYVIATAPGQLRSLTLADGSEVELNGSSVLRGDRRHPRRLELDRGQALFAVRHDERRPFTVIAAGREIRDVGTVFDVARLADGVRVEVAEGAVLFEPGAGGVRLAAGQGLEARRGGVRVGPIPARGIGSWRRRQLVYDGATLERLAADLSLSLGAPVRIEGAAAGRRFSGSISLAGGPERAVRSLAALMDLQASRQGEGWVLAARPRPAP